MLNNFWQLISQCGERLLAFLLLIGEFLSGWFPTYFILGALLLFLVFLVIRRELGLRKLCWLSLKIEKAKIELKHIKTPPPWHQRLSLFISQLYYPTASKFIFLIITLIAIFGIGNKCLWTPYENAEFYRSLVPIQTGVVALIFPIMIFIIGFSGNKLASGVNLSEVLLRESFLFPVGVIGLFFLVNLIWARSSYVVVGQIVLSALMYAVVLFRIIRILLNDKRLLEKSKELLKDKLRRSIEKTIEERLGNNILIEEFGDNKIELQYSFLGSHAKSR